MVQNVLGEGVQGVGRVLGGNPLEQAHLLLPRR
jgi:hypothetical protein